MARKRRDEDRGSEGPAEPAGNDAGRPARPTISSRHRHTLAAIFERPTRPDIPWRNIEALFAALGGMVQPGRGSRRRVVIGKAVATFHEPHPESTTDRGAVKDVRDFLISAGIGP